MGAFYVDQKKKGLLPNTLPSEHEQWGNLNVGTTDTKVALPINFSNNTYRVAVTSTWNADAIGSTLTEEFHNTGGKNTSAFYIKANYSNATDWIAIGI